MQEETQSKVSQKDIHEVFSFSQFINTIKLIKSQEQFKNLRPFSQVANTGLVVPSHFRQIAIQFFYLLYSCSHRNIVPIPQDSTKFLGYCSQKNILFICLKQFVPFSESQIGQTESNTPYFQYYKKFIHAIQQYWKQVQKTSPPIKRKCLTVDNFIFQLNSINKDLSSQKQAFNQFQKADMFIETSILLRIRNASLACIFRRDIQLCHLLKKYYSIQNSLSNEYNDRRKRKNNIEKVLQTERNIQKNIQDFFSSLTTNPKYIKQDQKKSKKQNSGMSKLVIGLKVYQLTDLLPKQMQEEEEYFTQYQIQYNSSRNTIIVRMITDIILDWSNSDSLLYKWNILTVQTSNVGLQTVERLDQNKKPRKFVVIRGNCSFNKKQPILQKILTLIDVTMATFKSIQLQMKSEQFFSKNMNKMQESYQKINHYLGLIYRSSMKCYNSILINPMN